MQRHVATRATKHISTKHVFRADRLSRVVHEVLPLEVAQRVLFLVGVYAAEQLKHVLGANLGLQVGAGTLAANAA